MRRLLARKGVAAPAADALAAGELVPRSPEDDPPPLSFAQQRMWLLDSLQPGNPFYNIPDILFLDGPLEPRRLHRALRGVVERHEVLRTAYALPPDAEATASAALGASPAAAARPREPCQLVQAQVDLPLPLLDLRGLAADPERQAAEVERLGEAEARRPLRLDQPPSLRTTLVRLEPHRHAFFVVLHHIAADGWSKSVLAAELAALYRGAALPPLPIQYADFALWQRRWLGQGELERQLAWWRGQLGEEADAGAVTALELPTDRPRPPEFSHRGAGRPLIVPAGLVSRLRALGRAGTGDKGTGQGSGDVTLFMLLLAGLQALLYRLSGQSDIAVGSPVANRRRAELEALIGFFANTLVLRTDLRGGPSFRQLLERVRHVTHDAFEHQDLPFERLVEELQPARDLSRTPLFQVLLVLQNTPPASAIEMSAEGSPSGEVSPAGDGPLVLQRRPLDTGTAKFDLTVDLASSEPGAGDVDGALLGGIEYATDLFDATTVDRLGAQLVRLLQAAVAQPEHPISALSLVTPAERQQLCVEWQLFERAGNAAESTSDVSIAAPVLRWAARSPDLIAVTADRHFLSYGELVRRSGHLAAALRAHGVGVDEQVCIAQDRVCGYPLALLGVLRAGAACVPLDLTWPAARHEILLAEAKPRLVLDAPTLAQLLEEGLLEEGPLQGRLPAESDRLEADGPPSIQALAYVLYTSGSTGTPKGVAMPHGPLRHMLAWQVRASAAGASADTVRSERTLQFASPGFDVSFQEIFSTWSAGGTLVMVREAVRRDPETLLDFLAERRIGRLFLPFVALQALAEVAAAQRAGRWPALREVMVAGEQLRVGPALRTWFGDLLRGKRAARLANHYGPTEAHAVSAEILPADVETWPSLPLVGRPVAGAVLYVVDPDAAVHGWPGVLSPIGVPGELLIGEVTVGDGALARGYLDRPRWTAERFVPDGAGIFACGAGKLPHGGRLYRSGDLARYLPDGRLECFGRLDAQVKVRGYRVEPGEVETVLASQPQVVQAVVVTRPSGRGVLLVAYVVMAKETPTGEPPASTRDPHLATLRDSLRGQLPDYMVPAHIVALDALPTTGSGKVDRRALQRLSLDAVTANAAAGGDASDAPSTPAEIQLAEIWCELLGVARVGVDDDFFDLGGHSLLATWLSVRARDAFEIELPVRAVFEHPRLAQLAVEIERLRRDGQGLSPLPPLRPRSAATPPDASRGHQDCLYEGPVSFAQERLWFLEQLRDGDTGYRLASRLRLLGDLDARALATAIDGLAARHETLRTVFADHDGEPIQRVLPPRRGALALPCVDLSGVVDRATETQRTSLLGRLTGTFQRQPLPLDTGPLLRLLLLRTGGRDEHLLLFNLHHIISDGWSMSVMFRDVGELYAAAVDGRAPRLPVLSVQYADFAAWQRGWLEGDRLDEQLTYWQQRLSEPRLPQPLRLPRDRPVAPGAGPGRGGMVTGALPPELARQVETFARRHDVTPFMVLLAAFAVLLGRLANTDDVLLGTPVANRRSRELEGLIGFFINLISLRLEVAPATTFKALLAQVRSVTLGAYDHQDIPFERLVELVQPDRRDGDVPLAQVTFQLLNTPRAEAAELPRLRMEQQPLEVRRAKLDLGLMFEGQGEHLGWLAEYDADRFDRASVEHWLAAFQELLASALAEPRQVVDDLPALDIVRRRQPSGVAPVLPSAPSLVPPMAPPSLAPPALAPPSLAPPELAPPELIPPPVASPPPLHMPEEPETPIKQPAEGNDSEPDEPLTLSDAPMLLPAARKARGVPLSFAQERLWFIDRLEPTAAAAYNTPGRIYLEGVVQPAALRVAIHALIARHESLRTVFVEIEAQPLQRVAAVASPLGQPPLPVVDLGGLAETDGAKQADVLTARAATHPFDLARGPLLQIFLLRLAAGLSGESTSPRHQLYFNLHHIVTDGWSMEILFREMARLYQAAATGGTASPASGPAQVLAQEAGLPPLPVQYPDFAVWQRAWLSGDELQRQIDYWRRQLAARDAQEGSPQEGGGLEWTRLQLPEDHPPPAEPRADRCGRLPVRLPLPLVRSLDGFARRHEATLFMTLLAGFALLLHRLTGQRDLTVGTPIANRRHVDVEGLIGFFANTLVLRADLTAGTGTGSGDPGFGQLVDRLRRTTLEAYDHQDLPFARLVEALQPERQLGRTPLFQVLFQLHKAQPVTEARTTEVTLELETLDAGLAKFDLELTLSQIQGPVAGTLVYNADRFDATTVRRWMDDYLRLMRAAVRAPERPVTRLDVLTPSASQQLVREWGSGPLSDTWSGPASRNQPEPLPTLPCLVFEQARRTPHAIAVQGRRHALSYATLTARARRLASALRHTRNDEESIIGLSLPRGPRACVALLGVLDSGAAVLPIDPAYPRERRDLMLQDSGTRRVLDGGAVDELLQLPDGAAEPQVATRASVPEPHPHQLCYLLYTSGSTGVPKGVAMRHGLMAQVLAWELRRNAPVPQTPVPQTPVPQTPVPQTSVPQTGPHRTLAFTPLSFDVSFQETFATWGAGGTLVLVDEDTRRDPHLLLRHLLRQRVQRLYLPFVALQALAEASAAPEAPRPDELVELITAGEQLRMTPALTAWLQRRPTLRLHNHYGPTETHAISAWSLGRRRPGELVRAPALPPIGRPIDGVRVYVVDSLARPRPIGCVGELWAGAEFADHGSPARGYHRRPALTAARFVPDPLIREPHRRGARVYRTGDLARYRADGELEFLGRRDTQLKVRGFRVEPGEVEAALEALAGVGQAVVVPRQGAGGVALIAYVLVAAELVASESPPDAASLRDTLRRRLPDYLVPAAVHVVETLPKTPSGKVDRRALRQRAAEQEAVAVEFVAPHSVTEEQLAALWADLLQRQQVGVRDHFFDIGGHSLLATTLTARLRDVFGVEVPVKAVFEHPHLDELAAEIDRLRATDSAPVLPPLEPVPRDARGLPLEPLPVSFAQERLWLTERLSEDAAGGYRLPGKLELLGDFRPLAMARALRRLVSRHETLRTVFAEVDGAPVQRPLPAREARVELPVVDLSRLAATTAAVLESSLTAQLMAQPMPLAEGPLLRVLLLRFAPFSPEPTELPQPARAKHLLLFNLHHIVADGWSMGILFREVSQFYRAEVEGTADALELPPLPVHYGDFAVWQRQWLSGERLDAQLSWWRQHLDGAPAAVELPADRPRPPRVGRSGALSDHLPASLEAGLSQLGRRHGATLYMVLLAAFSALLPRLGSGRDLVLGTPVANRRHRGLEGLIGFFINVLAVRLQPARDVDFATWLQQVRQLTLDVYDHQDLPFERLVEALQPAREPGRPSLVQVVFQLQNTPPAAAVELPGLQLRMRGVELERAKFDFSLMAERVGDASGGAPVVLVADYNADLFDATTVRRWLRAFEVLLEGAIAAPGTPLGALPVLDAVARQQALVEWNDVEAPYDRDATLPELFAGQVRQRPDAIGIVYGRRHLGYREIARRAGRIAALLSRRWAGRAAAENRVAVTGQRSPELVLATVGVTLAGGAYVPLDPDTPVHRLAFQLHDAGAEVLLVDAASRDHLAQAVAAAAELGSTESPATVELMDFEAVLAQDVPSAAPREALHPDDLHPENLVNIFYTSGSTGKPKGVAVTHRGVVRLIQAGVTPTAGYPGFGVERRVAQSANPVFDPTTYEIWGALVHGGCLVEVPKAQLLAPETLGDFLRARRIDVQYLTVAVVSLIARQAPDALNSVDVQLLGGEAIAPARVAEILDAGSPRHLIHVYGPTETTAWCSYEDLCKLPVLPSGGRVPSGQPTLTVGRAVPNDTIYYLDGRFRPVPTGCPGEICAGGDGVVRGYLGRPGRTAEVFIPDALSGRPGARLYRTGDLGRWRADGRLEFLGRVDFQVKIRGLRIEPGEIEAVLRRYPEVRDAVVLVLGEGDERQLGACVLTRPDESPSSLQVRDTRDEPPEIWPNVGEYQIYDELLYYAMSRDVRRNQAYRQALQRLLSDAASPGLTVLDVGTGHDAIWARYAAEAGAAHVYGLEVLEASAAAAREEVRRAGLDDRITILHGDVTDPTFRLPPHPDGRERRVDLIVSNLIGTIGGCEAAPVLLGHARRFLAPGGRMIPARCRTRLAGVTLPPELQDEPRFTPLAADFARRVFDAVGHPFDVRLNLRHFPPSLRLTVAAGPDGDVFEDLDFRDPHGQPAATQGVFSSPVFSSEYERRLHLRVELPEQSDARLDGFLLWLELQTAAPATQAPTGGEAPTGEASIVLETLDPPCSWLPVYLPVFEPPQRVRTGDEIELTVEARLAADGLHPDYHVRGWLRRDPAQGGDVEIDFESPFVGPAVPAASAAAHPPSRRPALYRALFGDSGEPRVAQTAQDALLAELHAHLQTQLPDFMVPSRLLALDALPLTPNGKVDRAELSRRLLRQAAAGAIRAGEAAEVVTFDGPHAETARTIATVWQDVLGLESSVGPEDQFFALGGHSLLATRVISRLRKTFELDIPLRWMFESPTPAELAPRVDGLRPAPEAAVPAGDAEPPLVPVPRDQPLPLSYAQQRLWLADQLQPGDIAYNMPLGVRLRSESPEGELDIAALSHALDTVVARHEALRTTFPVGSDGEPVQHIAGPRPSPLPVVDLSALPEEVAQAESERLGLGHARHRFDLARGPLLVAAIVRQRRDDHALLLNLHHVIADGWSLAILVRELSGLYRALLEPGQDRVELPELAIQYADFAVWQRRYLAGDGLDGDRLDGDSQDKGAREQLLDHWRQVLAGAPPVLDLPSDRPRPEVRSLRGDRRVRGHQAEQRQRLEALAQAHQGTLFMVLLAAFKTLLYRLTGQHDIVVGTDIANRNRPEIEDLIGFFINHPVLRTDLAGNPTFAELVDRVRAVTVDAYAHQDLPFDLLVEELQPERSPSVTPLFQVLFVMQNAPTGGTPVTTGLTLEAMPGESHSSKYDLVVEALEFGDGLALSWTFRTDIFDAATVEQLAERYALLLDQVAADPDRRLDELSLEIESDKERRAMEEQQRRSLTSGLRRGRRKAVQLDAVDPIKSRVLDGGPTRALVLEPAVPDVDLTGWAAAQRDQLDRHLDEYGAVLLRGFHVREVEEFERFAAAVCGELYSDYGDLPHDAAEGQVYTATPYPPDQRILYHNESSQMDKWPMRQIFWCAQPSLVGGETPITDCRQVYKKLDPKIRADFAQKGLMYVRNFVPGVDVPWQEFFRSEDQATVEARCRAAGMDVEWLADGGLRTKRQGPGVARHPRTGEEIFFNQIQAHHIACLEPEVRKSLLEITSEEGLPRNVTFGDGTPIPDDVVQQIVELYDELSLISPWQQGDVLVVDNMLMAHARNTFSGPRKIYVAMGRMVTFDEIKGNMPEG